LDALHNAVGGTTLILRARDHDVRDRDRDLGGYGRGYGYVLNLAPLAVFVATRAGSEDLVLVVRIAGLYWSAASSNRRNHI
jgi:hypothetical protein